MSMKPSSRRQILPVLKNIPPIKKNPNFAAEYLIYTDINKPLVTDMYYKMSGPRFGELSFKEFILLLIKEIERPRRFGYVRLFLYLEKEDFEANGSEYFSIFLRNRDVYVVGLQDIDGTVYEVGKADEKGRYFHHSFVTGFGQCYSELFQGSNGNLEGIWIGFHQLNKAILNIIKERDPLTRNRDWAWSIGQFALTFSECARFVWYHDIFSWLMESNLDIPMMDEHCYKYGFMALLPKKWKVISDCARRTPNLGETNEPQDKDEKYTKAGVKKLTEIVRYAFDSLHILSWEYGSQGDYYRRSSYEEGGGVGRGYGEGGGGYGVYAGDSCALATEAIQSKDTGKGLLWYFKDELDNDEMEKAKKEMQMIMEEEERAKRESAGLARKRAAKRQDSRLCIPDFTELIKQSWTAEDLGAGHDEAAHVKGLGFAMQFGQDNLLAKRMDCFSSRSGNGGGEGGDDGGGQGPEGGYDSGGLGPRSRDVDHGVGGYHGGRNQNHGRGRNNYAVRGVGEGGDGGGGQGPEGGYDRGGLGPGRRDVDQSDLPILPFLPKDELLQIFPRFVNLPSDKFQAALARILQESSQGGIDPEKDGVLLQLPPAQLEIALNKQPVLKGPLVSYASQPDIRSSLPRSSLVVLGILPQDSQSASQAPTTQSKSQSQTQSQAQSLTQSQVQSQPQSQSQSQAQSQSQSQAQSQSQSQSQPQSQSQSQPQSQSQSQAQSPSQSQAQSQTHSQAQSQTGDTGTSEKEVAAEEPKESAEHVPNMETLWFRFD